MARPRKFPRAAVNGRSPVYRPAIVSLRLALLFMSCLFAILTLVLHILLVRFFSYEDNSVLPILDIATSAIRGGKPVENILKDQVRVYVAVDWFLFINALLFYSVLHKRDLYKVVAVNVRNFFYIFSPFNITIILIIFAYVVFRGYDIDARGIMYREDGVGETATVILLISAACYFFLSSRRLRERGEKLVSVIVFLVLVFTILLALEEVSWGQRIFGWSTPAFISDLNYQDETNLHNMLGEKHSYLILVEFSIGFAVSTLIVLAYEFRREKKFGCFKILTPDKKMLLFTLIVPFPSLTNQYHELLEELVAVGLLFYAMTLWKTQRKFSSAAECRDSF